MNQSVPHPQHIHNALSSIPNATYVLTCKHDKYRDGIITNWVQQCSTDPPMLVVAIKKGQTIEPMLRDARAFALSMVMPGDRRVKRFFGNSHEVEEDPFLSLTTDEAVTGMPILQQSIAWFDCKLEGHLSPDADCRLYLGQVVAASIKDQTQLSKRVDEKIKPPSANRIRNHRSTSKQLLKQLKK